MVFAITLGIWPGTASATDSPVDPGFPTTPILDRFDRSDGSLGENWSSPIWSGDDGGKIAGNQYRADSAWGESYWNAETFDDTQVYATAVNDEQPIGLLLRLSDAGGAPDGYEASFDNDGWSFRFNRIEDGNYVDIGNFGHISWGPGDQLGFAPSAAN